MESSLVPSALQVGLGGILVFGTVCQLAAVNDAMSRYKEFCMSAARVAGRARSSVARYGAAGWAAKRSGMQLKLNDFQDTWRHVRATRRYLRSCRW
jgi:hypothetical protein